MSKLIYITNTSLDGYVEDETPEHRDFARVWQKAEKIVFSRTLTGATTRNTRVERDFDLEAIRKLKRESEHDISIGGAELAGLALEADLVDECQLFLNPVIVGGGKPAFRAALRRNVELLETRRFGTGVRRRTPLTRRMPAASSGLSRPASAASYAIRRTAASRRLMVAGACWSCSRWIR
jgi:dihydrofolate reductase